jgi:glycosyltransferase involved in cell wall biosynthesis
VSDGSTDRTEEVVKSLEDKRVKLFKHTQSRGASAARNTGFNHSFGKYIAFLDDDDTWVPAKLASQVELLENSKDNVGLVYCWIEYFDSINNKVISERCPTLKGNILIHMLDKQAITNSSSLLVRREVFEVVGGFDETLYSSNDGDFIRRVAKKYLVDFVPQINVRLYVGHNDRLSIPSKRHLENRINAFKKWLVYFKSEYEKHPTKKANALAQIAEAYLYLGNYKLTCNYVIQIVNTSSCLGDKVAILGRILKVAIRSNVVRFTKKT